MSIRAFTCMITCCRIYCYQARS